MTVERIDHVGIAVRSIDDVLPYYRDVLGLRYVCEEEVPDQKVRVAFLEIGESRIELLEPTSDDSPISGFLDKRGGGMHHIAVLVEDIEEALQRHRAAGSRLIDERPRNGAHGMRIAFVHPKTTAGVLLELCQHSSD
ncbi:MAG: methylmalonyl-CoA epimerase [Candidatus Thorarchaeota archaeon]|nr:MAG: methylmalonyl-CoA epimerase [Candidatus Thorarchaeota archaeon]